MLKFHWSRCTDHDTTTSATSATSTPSTPSTPSTRHVTTTRDDLRIRNLLDDPRLAKAMTLDLGPAFATAVPATDLAPRRDRPERVFNRRRLLESDAA